MAYKDISDNSEVIGLRNRLNDIVFKELEGYKVGTILTVPLFSIDSEDNSNINLLKYMIKLCFLWDYKKDVDKQQIVYFKSVDYVNALNYQKMFSAMIEAVGAGMQIDAIKRIHIGENFFKYMALYETWKRTIFEVNKNREKATFLALHLIRAYIELEKFKRLIKDVEEHIVVTFCDVHPVDAIITQYVNLNGGITVTLQHGHFNAMDRGWVFNQSKSKYFLLHGEYAKQEALQSDHYEEGLVSVGMMNFIGVERKDFSIDLSNRNFALILNGPGAKEDNEGFIMCANEFARAHNMKYIVRAHPAVPAEMYEAIIDKNYMFEVSRKDESIKNLFDRVQFVMVGNSTVFIEALYLGKLTFRYAGISQDIYEKVNWCRFCNIVELSEVYESSISDLDLLKEKVSDTIAQLCQDGNIGKNYKEFFERISTK